MKKTEKTTSYDCPVTKSQEVSNDNINDTKYIKKNSDGRINSNLKNNKLTLDIKTRRVRSVAMEEVIRVEVVLGDGITTPIRIEVQYWTKDGRFIGT